MRAPKPYEAVNIIRHANGYSLEAVPANLGAAGALTRPAPLEEVQVFNSIDALFTHLRRGFQDEPVNTCSAEKVDPVQLAHERINKLNTMLADVCTATADKVAQMDGRIGLLEKGSSLVRTARETANARRRAAARKVLPKRKR